MADIDKLRENFEKAERTLQQESAAYDAEKARLKKRYQGKLAKLAERTRDAQKALNDAEAAKALLDRTDEYDALVARNELLPEHAKLSEEQMRAQALAEKRTLAATNLRGLPLPG
jgi:DNA polymerase III delta prime subunit